MINYCVTEGPWAIDTGTLRLSRGGIEARDYRVGTIPWMILDSVLWYHKRNRADVDPELGEYIWNNFDETNYMDASG
jgi:hypothetical protein